MAIFAAEGASSHYLPGTVGDIFLAVPPEPGLMAANRFWYQTGSTDAAVRALSGFPPFGGGRLTVLGKWLHDFSADNRFESDYITLTAAWQFVR